MKQLPPSGATDRDRDFAIRQLIDGRSNAAGTVTLNTLATTTTVSRTNCNENAVVLLFPKNTAAAGVVTSTYVSSVTKTGFTITHSNLATTRIFGYLVVGG